MSDSARTSRSYLLLTSRPGGGATTPIFLGSGVGAAVSAVVSSVTGFAIPALAPILPMGLAGLDIRETLHRFDANAHLPTRERGVSSANRVGEPLAMISMEWRPAADGADPSSPPPDLEVRSDVSQRFVMRNGALRFEDRRQGTLRFAGTGRTYPAVTDGQARLLFAGTAVVTESTGSLAGARGVLMISGEMTRPSLVSLTVVARLDAGSPVAIEDTLSPLRDAAAGDSAVTVLTLVGDTEPNGAERIRAARIGNDLTDAKGLRSLLRVGTKIGTVHGRFTADKDNPATAIPLPQSSRVLTFADPAGVPVGSITVANLEGITAHESREGHRVRRVTAYGPATDGTGALTGAGGILSLDMMTDANGSQTTVYSLRLVDPGRRFRAAYADVYKPMMTAPAADAPPPPAPVESLVFVDGPAGYMSAADRAILRYAERALADGAELAAWCAETKRTCAFGDTFDIGRTQQESSRSFGFFDSAVVANQNLPVMGVVQEMFYDRQAGASGDVRDQLREFVLRYFLRVSRIRPADPGSAGQATALSGSGFQQLFFRLRESGKIGRFLGEERSAIVDLRDIGRVYDWVVLKVDLFDFVLSFAPFGSAAPRVQMPLKDPTYLVLGPPFVKFEEQPASDVIGRYGFGYAVVPYAPGGPGVIAYGPGHFATAIQQVEFTISDSGEIRVQTAFVVHRPNRIARVDIDPIDWSFRLADLLTFGTASRVMGPVKEVADALPLRVSGLDPVSTYLWVANAVTAGLAAKRFGHSKVALEKRLLIQHFMQHYEMLIASLLVWRMVPDWMDPERVPAFCRQGAAS